MEDGLLREGERLEELGIEGYRIIQHDKLFKFGTDAVLLSGFAASVCKPGTQAVDLGTGQGIIPVLLCGKTQCRRIVGVEIQERLSDMARRSAALNRLEDRIEILHADIRTVAGQLKKGGFDLVVSNPPYKPLRTGLQNEAFELLAARHEILCTLEDVVSAASALLRYGGHFCLCHRPERLPDIICLMRRYRLEPKRMRLVHDKKDSPPSIVLVEGRRGSGPFLKVERPLILRDEDGGYIREALEEKFD